MTQDTRGGRDKQKGGPREQADLLINVIGGKAKQGREGRRCSTAPSWKLPSTTQTIKRFLMDLTFGGSFPHSWQVSVSVPVHIHLSIYVIIYLAWSLWQVFVCRTPPTIYLYIYIFVRWSLCVYLFTYL